MVVRGSAEIVACVWRPYMHGPDLMHVAAVVAVQPCHAMLRERWRWPLLEWRLQCRWRCPMGLCRCRSRHGRQAATVCERCGSAVNRPATPQLGGQSALLLLLLLHVVLHWHRWEVRPLRCTCSTGAAHVSNRLRGTWWHGAMRSALLHHVLHRRQEHAWHHRVTHHWQRGAARQRRPLQLERWAHVHEECLLHIAGLGA